MNSKEKATEWLNFLFLDDADKQEIKNNLNNEKWLRESFGSDLEFGTGGLRGVVGPGISKMNKYNVRKITLGLCNAAKKFGNKIVIGYDSRLSSLDFAHDTAAVCLKQGFEVFLFSRPTATPAVSFAIRKLNATIGVNITASHNPPEYNGYKVYWSDGAQVTAPNDQAIMKQVTFVSDYALAMEGNFNKSEVKYISPEIENAYFQYLDSTIPAVWKPSVSKKVAYTPLHGVGKWWVDNFFKTNKRENFFSHVSSQSEPDGNFPTVKYANPEDTTSLSLLIEHMNKEKLKYGLATDPDADRLAVVELKEGHPHFFSGNDVGAIFSYLFLETLSKENGIPKNSFMVRTIVSSNLIDKIAKDFQVSVKTCLTGFKHIAKVIQWSQDSLKMKFLFGTEESIGYLFGDEVRDKDGIQATLMMGYLIQYLETKGLSLTQVLNDIYKKYGIHTESLKNLNLKDYNLNFESMLEKMEKLRSNYPEEIAGFKVEHIFDYQKSAKFRPGDIRNYEQIEMPQSNVIAFELSGNARVMIRPSGTEPKVKIYTQICSLPGETTSMDELKTRLLEIESSLTESYLSEK